MLTLVRREIRDNFIHVLTPCVLGLITVGVLLTAFLSGISGVAIPLGGLMLLVMCVGFSVLGAAQMYGDRANRVSSLLSTLAVTRDHILAARVLVGVLAVFVALVPLLIAAMILLQVFLPPLEFYRRLIVEVSVTTILMGLASYGVGLLVGGTTNRVWLVVGDILLLALCLSLVAVKGFGPAVMVVLVVLIAALLARTWQKFTVVSL